MYGGGRPASDQAANGELAHACGVIQTARERPLDLPHCSPVEEASRAPSCAALSFSSCHASARGTKDALQPFISLDGARASHSKQPRSGAGASFVPAGLPLSAIIQNTPEIAPQASHALPNLSTPAMRPSNINDLA